MTDEENDEKDDEGEHNCKPYCLFTSSEMAPPADASTELFAQRVGSLVEHALNTTALLYRGLERLVPVVLDNSMPTYHMVMCLGITLNLLRKSVDGWMGEQGYVPISTVSEQLRVIKQLLDSDLPEDAKYYLAAQLAVLAEQGEKVEDVDWPDVVGRDDN